MSDNRKAFEDEVQSFVSSQPEWRYADTEALWWFFWKAATEQSSKEIERLNALVAMKDEALKYVQPYFIPNVDCSDRMTQAAEELIEEALSASSSTVEKWEAEKLLPLQRQVAAMSELYYELAGIAADVDSGNGFDIVCRKTLQRVMDALSNPQAIAEAYDREHAIKSAGEFKALLLESTKVFVHPHIEGVFAVWEERLRAANKKEGE